jgi:hypothetical protein
MEKTFHELDLLQTEINLEKNNYKQAIINHKELADVKLIYLKIKELEKQASDLMHHAQKIYKG